MREPSARHVVLQLNAVSKSHWRGPREVRVLEDVSLPVHEGELVGVHGQRGAGKTTLLRIAAGFDPPDAGTVSFAGIDLAGRSRRDLARIHHEQISWVERAGPQSAELSILIYVALPLYRRHGPIEAQRRAFSALARVGAEDTADLRWSDLSDAARILIAIAQALVRKPRLLLVEDPTAGLGTRDRERVVGLLRSAAEDDGVAVLMAVSDMRALVHAGEVRSLSSGRLHAPADRPADAPGTVVEFPRGDRSA